MPRSYKTLAAWLLLMNVQIIISGKARSQKRRETKSEKKRKKSEK